MNDRYYCEHCGWIGDVGELRTVPGATHGGWEEMLGYACPECGREDDLAEITLRFVLDIVRSLRGHFQGRGWSFGVQEMDVIEDFLEELE